MDLQPENEKTTILRNALAEYFECDPETVGAFVIACERADENENAMFSTAWSGLAHWHVMGFVKELEHRVKDYRDRLAMEHLMSEHDG